MKRAELPHKSLWTRGFCLCDMVYIFFADGFEEIEALAPVDILRRAGLAVTTVGVTGKVVTGSHQIPVTMDADLSAVDLQKARAVILPGGALGTENLEKSDAVQAAIDHCMENGKLIAAICAAPSILAHKGLLSGKTATAYPSFQTHLLEGGATVPEDYVCHDGNMITARGMGVANEFSFEIVKTLVDAQTADKVREEIQCPR